MNKKVYMRKGDRVIVQHGRGSKVVCVVARIENVGYHLISTATGTDMGKLTDEGWYPPRQFHVVSVETSKWDKYANMGTDESANTYQNELSEYFG